MCPEPSPAPESAVAEPAEKNFLVSWDQLHRDTRALAWRLAPTPLQAPDRLLHTTG